MASAVKIRAAGAKPAPKPKAKPAAKRSGAKATTRPTTRGKRTTAKATPAKRAAGRTRKTEAATEGTKRNTTGLAKTDPKLEARLLKAVTAAGDRRREAKIEHEESVNALYEVAKEALEAGVSMAKVSDASDISRQWLYKMGEFAGRENGGNGASTSKAKPAAKRAAKSTTKATPAKRTSTRKGRATTAKRGTKATAAKPRTRTRIRTAA